MLKFSRLLNSNRGLTVQHVFASLGMSHSLVIQVLKRGLGVAVCLCLSFNRAPRMA